MTCHGRSPEISLQCSPVEPLFRGTCVVVSKNKIEVVAIVLKKRKQTKTTRHVFHIQRNYNKNL